MMDLPGKLLFWVWCAKTYIEYVMDRRLWASYESRIVFDYGSTAVYLYTLSSILQHYPVYFVRQKAHVARLTPVM